MKYKYLIAWIIALAAIAGGLLVYESHFLWKVQELNLFLNTSLFFKQQMVVPAGMLTYMGTWFTQLFYHPWIGVTTLCLWWLLLLFLLKRTFAVPAKWASLLLIPVALLLLTDVDMGYWVYILKLRGHFFLTTIATAAVVALLWGYRSLPDKYWLRAVYMVLTCFVGYPLMGIYGLAATLLMGIWAWRLMPRWRAAVYTVVAVLIVVAVPLLCYHYVYHEINLANIYYAGLPLYFVTERYTDYYIPFYLLALFMVVMVCLPLKVKNEKSQVKNKTDKSQTIEKELKENALIVENKYKNNALTDDNKQMYKAKTVKNKRKDKAPVVNNQLNNKNSVVKNKQKLKSKEWMPMAYNAVVLAVVVWGVVHFWYKDENFHHEVKMQHLIDQVDWEGVLKEAATQKDEPTRAIIMMRNLALSRLGRQGSDMYLYRNGAKQYNAPFPMRLMMSCGTLIYYQYGMLNFCNRLCTELGVEFDWRAEHYKYMIRCALMNGEKNVARKYINILKHTTFFDEWAEKAEKLLNNPQLIAKDREMEPITHMLHYSDQLTGDNAAVEHFLMNQLAKSNYPDDPIFQEQSLLASLWVKDPKLFWRQFSIYYQQHPKSSIPLAYQQAAYLFALLEDRPDLDKMTFISQSVKDTFNKFLEVASRFEGMGAEQARKQMGDLYNDNYFYDYHMMSNLPE